MQADFDESDRALRNLVAGRCRVPDALAGRVGEWLKPADCKSAAPCGLRRFESSPVHQRRAIGGEVVDGG
jgi:hypothetical protein